MKKNYNYNPFRLEGQKRLKKEAYKHYKNGLSYRQIGVLMSRSHEWARQAVKTYAQVN